MIFKFVKFYKADEGVAYAVDAEGHVFRLGPGMRVEHAEALPDGIKEVSAEEWASEHLPISFEIHIAGEEAKERELTPEEKAMDERYRLELRDWLKRRNTFVGESLKASCAPAVLIAETTTREYGSPLLVDAVAALVGFGIQEPEDPIEWRRAARKGQLADVIRDMVPSVMEVVGQMVNAKVQAKVTRQAPPVQPPAPSPDPAAPTVETKAEEKGQGAGR